jgi:protein-S-isoprenylcysteine O-methyltransferase Ste14
MRKILALAGSFLFLLIVPGTVAGYLPWAISHWQLQPAFLGLEATRWLGAALIGLGLIALVESFARFALKGLGTPAPIPPTRHLVVSGFCRHVRNPMYVGVVAAIAGQALLFADAWLLGYAAVAWVFMHLFVVAYEEPRLHLAFGAEYDAFRTQVPRWLPRLKAWSA